MTKITADRLARQGRAAFVTATHTLRGKPGKESPGDKSFIALNSPLTKSGSADSLRLWRFGRVIGDGNGAVGGGSGRPDGDVGGDAALAGTRVLRPVAGAASEGGVRRVRGRGVQALLRAEDGRAVAAAGAVLPHAHDRLFRGDRQRARHCVALRGLVLAARFPAAVEPRQGARSFVAVAHALASAARGA